MLTAHDRFLALCNIAGIVLLAGLGPAHAQGVTVSQSTASVSADCAGGDAVIQGSRDSISLRNSCRSVTVNGSGNSITADLQAGWSITLNGAGNTVSYRPVGGPQGASVADNGHGNTVAMVARQGGAEPGTTTIIGGTSGPGSLTVHGGNGDTVQIGPGGITAIPGTGTTGGVVQIGPGGIAAAAGAAGAAATLAAPAGTATGPQLVFSGDGQNRDAACAGERVYVTGDNGHFTLRGGCAGLAIQGDRDVAQVELAPGAPIAITGDNSVVYVVLTTPGADPTLIVSSSNSHAIRVNHLGEVSGVEIPAAVRQGSVVPPAGAPVAGAGIAVLTPQAALATARGETVVQLQRNLGAVQTPQGTQVRLSGDVLFDFDKDTLRPDAQRSLAELSVLIAHDHPRGLQIVGYTDSFGTPQYNLDLSDRRARNVERWLLDYGRVQTAALDVRGRGASNPIAPNILADGGDNPAGRQANRRVEVLLEQ
jgi:outer membrane protein OmpA-like peptidoglycan-associated protein